jgi:hypothetical protein
VPLAIAEGINNTDQTTKKNKKSDPENKQALKDNFGELFEQMRKFRAEGSKLTLTDGTVLTFKLKGGFDLKTLAALHGMACTPLTKEALHRICAQCDCTARPDSKGKWHGHKKLTYADLPDSLLFGVLDLEDIVMCNVHCKMRTTEHLLQYAGELAISRGTFESWLKAVRCVVPSFWAWKKKGGKRVKIPMMMGPMCERMLEFSPCPSDQDATQGNFVPMLRAIFGPSDRAKTPVPFEYARLKKEDRDDYKQLASLWRSWQQVNLGMRLRTPTENNITCTLAI